MTSRDRWEARVAIAMLPVGAAMTLAAVIGFVMIGLLAIDTIVRTPAATGLILAWCLAAAAVAIRNLMKSIETMSSFEWRPLAEVAMLSGVIVLAYPGWWIGG